MAVHGILGKKVGMTQIFTRDGDGRAGHGRAGGSLPRRAEEGHGQGRLRGGPDRPRRIASGPPRQPRGEGTLREGRRSLRCAPSRRCAWTRETRSSLGTRSSATLSRRTDHVDVIGVSKGKGFAGVVRRHHFRGGGATHGSMFHRAPGSIGPSAFPSRVYPGTRSSGRLGGKRATAKNLVVVTRGHGKKPPLHLGGRPGGAQQPGQDRALDLRGAGELCVSHLRCGAGVRRIRHPGGSQVAWRKSLSGTGRTSGSGSHPSRRDLRLSVPPPPRVGGREGLPRCQAQRHAQDEDALGGLRLGPEALQAEGDRPGPAGRQPASDPSPRRDVSRAGAALLRPGDLGEREEERAQGGSLPPRRGGAARRRRGDGLGHPSHAGPEGAVGRLGIEGKTLFVELARE